MPNAAFLFLFLVLKTNQKRKRNKQTMMGLKPQSKNKWRLERPTKKRGKKNRRAGDWRKLSDRRLVGMEATLMASPSSLSALHGKIAMLLPGHRHRPYHCCNLSVVSYGKRQHLRSHAKLWAAQNFGRLEDIAGFAKKLAERLYEAMPEPLEKFPWEQAKETVTERSLALGATALKWSSIVLFVLSALSDLSLAISRNRELLVPVGLFVGVALADFMKEASAAYFEGSNQDVEFRWHLIGVASLFVLLKLVSLAFRLQGRVLLSHIGNGGLMQVLWLAKKLPRNGEIVGAEEQAQELAT